MSSDNTYLVVGIIIVAVVVFLTLYAPKKQAEITSSVKKLLTDSVDDLEDIGGDAVGLGEDVLDVLETPFSDTDDSDTDDSDTDNSDTDDSDDEGGGPPTPPTPPAQMESFVPRPQAVVNKGQEGFNGTFISSGIAGPASCPSDFNP